MEAEVKIQLNDVFVVCFACDGKTVNGRLFVPQNFRVGAF
jgi:hypothetical protein